MLTRNFADGSLLYNESCQNQRFNIFIGLLFGSALFTDALTSFTDSLIVNFVSESNTLDSYGEQRLFDSIGFGHAAIVVGGVADLNTTEDLPKYAPAFFIILATSLLLL